MQGNGNMVIGMEEVNNIGMMDQFTKAIGKQILQMVKED